MPSVNSTTLYFKLIVHQTLKTSFKDSAIKLLLSSFKHFITFKYYIDAWNLLVKGVD
jgi:hypothetical protein